MHFCQTTRPITKFGTLTILECKQSAKSPIEPEFFVRQNSPLAVFKFGLLITFKDSSLLYVYSIFVSIALIIFGYAFTKLGKVNKVIGLFSILFIATSIYVTASNIFTTKVCSMLEDANVNIHDVLEHEKMLASSGYINIVSYSCLFVVFLLLYINQKVVHTKTFKVKVEAPVED